MKINVMSNYNFLNPFYALSGAILMEILDIVAGIIIPPAKLPIGIIMEIVCAPVFIFILVRGNGKNV